MCNVTVFERAKIIKEKGFPSRLYKYRYFDKDDHWIDWVKGTIYLVSPSSFNDPFDCSFTSDVQVFRNHFIREPILAFIKKRFKPSKADITRIEIAEDPLLAAKTVLDHHGHHFDSGIDKLLGLDRFEGLLQDLVLITCFSEINDSILMWSHYADQHSGFCIEYDFRNDELLSNMTFPVIYSNDRVSYQEEPKTGEVSWITSAILCKSLCWNYEQEWRFYNPNQSYSNNSNQKNIYYLDVSSCIRSFYVGVRITESNLKRICDLASRLSLPVYKMNMDNTSFQLCPSKL